MPDLTCTAHRDPPWFTPCCGGCDVLGCWLERGENPMTDAAVWLRERADSYARDSAALAAEGDLPMAAAYQAIAEELRATAALLPKGHAG